MRYVHDGTRDTFPLQASIASITRFETSVQIWRAKNGSPYKDRYSIQIRQTDRKNFKRGNRRYPTRVTLCKFPTNEEGENVNESGANVYHQQVYHRQISKNDSCSAGG